MQNRFKDLKGIEILKAYEIQGNTLERLEIHLHDIVHML